MDPHPDFAGVDLPRAVDLPPFCLTPLSMAQVDEDFEAVTGAAGVLTGFWGSWPEGLTREEDLIDLAWHDREFTLRRSFSWIVRDEGGRYIGCAYLFPDPGARGSANVVTWMCDLPDRKARLASLNAALATWFEGVLPGGIALRWTYPD
ncbi:hypothetical protein JQU17_11265 [Ponticoccus sp. SC2-23]|uniref:hypothetical protein n=1 Tax=Alexandriicola marinus TaxID=2081710 RepID=UPI000FD93BF8|nr:hypothetical protein [Alexandriicola marinus]MBM1221472.1 hypothetical protein [Ponticoccus sp. SC6-9]MBM1226513.1 hypothetical protein [Ponticoccus sp. SC6-15]MBM1230464.1 hypothetical protein [Ponticoccus sp. SC6-38]MBM1234987.1 hypothetical protein [Ponticoccus sp. SC6-45]MBM1239485.1 hypothetical protein [Ponticoccus sp. SC6-49]MBM1243267.1 hypothetical protein [Ponticoccus sp. SC2-64]MBM1248511.1 hypothetical protein [Ponticoccus sp. SC6-42]MBM1253096.1 hypothetical protein [Pontico